MEKDTIKVYVPKCMLHWAHKFRIALNPIYSDENYETDIVLDMPLADLITILEGWGCEIGHPNQYWYFDQIASGHIFLKNGKQFHLRVYTHPNGLMLKGHIEWHGLTHPILHILYANLNYKKGYKMLKKLLGRSKIKTLIDKGKGKYN